MAYTTLFAGKAHAALYKAFRPTYSPNIFSFISSTLDKLLVKDKNDVRVAVDFACGGGQSTPFLTALFDYVIGMDVSQSQVEEAKDANACDDKGDYLLGLDSAIPLRNASCNYIQAFQAAHWFDLQKFYPEVDRILKPGGVLVFGVHGLGSLRAVDNPGLVEKYGEDCLKSFNDEFKSMYDFLKTSGYFPAKARNDVESLYVEYPMPYEEQIRCYDQKLTEKWPVTHFLGCSRSWSGWQQYVKKTGDSSLMDNLEAKWRAKFGDDPLVFSWPMGLHFSRKPFAK